MATAVTLLLPDQVYEQATRLAKDQHLGVDQMLVNTIIKTVMPKAVTANGATQSPEEMPDDTDEADADVERERDAYIVMHAFLKAHYFGKHVAIYQGQLIDIDDDYESLYRRIDAAYPNDFVWLDTVGEEPIRTIFIRSPTFLEY